MRRRFNRMSPFRIWLNSWATTPWSSSRVSQVTHPRVTPITAFPGSVPAAKALMPSSSSRTKTGGTGTPDAIAISSTTLRSRRSSGSAVPGSSGRPPRRRAMPSPPEPRALIL